VTFELARKYPHADFGPETWVGYGAFRSLEYFAEMGASSRKIIAGWRTNRFAAGLKSAVECALKMGPKRAGLLDRLRLTALTHR